MKKLRDEMADEVEIPHFAKSFSERAGHIATYKDGFDACHDLLMKDVSVLIEALEYYQKGNASHGYTYDESKAKEALAEWNAKYGEEK